MSLVVAYIASGCQVWCCDGRTYKTINNELALCGENAVKIRPAGKSNILIGWVGQNYDADMIIKLVSPNPASPPSDLIQDASIACQGINSMSLGFSCFTKQPSCPTGLLVGGYHEGKGFLSTVSPYGDINYFERYAAIGIGTNVIMDSLRKVRRHPLNASRAVKLIKRCISDVAQISDFIGGRISWFFITTERSFEVPDDNVDSCDDLIYRQSS